MGGLYLEADKWKEFTFTIANLEKLLTPKFLFVEI